MAGRRRADAGRAAAGQTRERLNSVEAGSPRSAPTGADGLREAGAAAETAALLERMAQLELALEDQEYVRLAFGAEMEFSRDGLRQICELARVMWLKNPLISRGVGVQAHYVFGQGVNIKGRSPAVDEVVQAFLDDPRNRAELTGQQALMIKEIELQITANLFFVFFTQPVTGRTRIRTIPFEEIDEIVCNPEDAKEPWFYRRTWTQEGLPQGEHAGSPLRTVTAYYPDWRYRPRSKPRRIGGHEVRWDTPVYHRKVNCLSDMRFGVSEVYAAIDWARAYKEFLEDWSTIVRAYSRFAWQLTVKGGKAGVQAARTKMGTTLGGALGGAETNPPPTTGAMFIGQTDTRLEPIRTAGATTSAEDGRRLLLMVAAALGLPESFFGDVNVGTLATAKSLDRPTELKMRSRQSLWAEVFSDILSYVIERSVRAPRGPLQGTVRADDDTVIVTLAHDPATGEPLDAAVDVDFPPILEHDIDARVGAIIAAATLDGKPLAGTMSLETVARLLLTALGEDDLDLDAPDLPDAPDAPDEPEAEGMAEAMRELREALRGFVEGPDDAT